MKMRHYERIIKAEFGQNDNIFFSLQSTSSCFSTFLLIFVIYLPKFRKLSNVSPNRSTVLSSGDATPSANSDSLTLGFCERTGALCFFRGKGHLVITKPLTHHPKFLIDNMVDNSWISISKIQLIIICIVQQLGLFDERK